MEQEQIARVRRMEAAYDRCRKALSALERALAAYRKTLPELDELIGYYDSGLWRRDYLADEDGAFPAEMKRGVLSEDGIYDLLADLLRVKEEMKELAERMPG